MRAHAGGAGRMTRQREGGQPDDSEGTPLAPGGYGNDTAGMGSAAARGVSDEASLAHADFRHLNQPDALFAIDEAMRRFALAAARHTDTPRTPRRFRPRDRHAVDDPAQRVRAAACRWTWLGGGRSGSVPASCCCWM
ncbi:hypothetical protein ACU4GD_23700 [Cupriavidus basilensis]